MKDSQINVRFAPTGTDYVALLAPAFDAFLVDAHRHLWQTPTREGEWCARGRITQPLAFLAAALNRLTGEDRYRALARTFLLDYEAGYHFEAIHFAEAWRMIAPDFPPADRRRAASAWVSDIPACRERYIGPAEQNWRAWTHVKNHALCTCVYAEYARTLFPEQADPYRFERWLDPLWERWWRIGEFQEQACNYECFAEYFLCQWAALRGASEAFYALPSVRNMFARNLRTISIAGLPHAYGDSPPVEPGVGWLALFERVARDTGDGAFRQAVGELFGYLRDLGVGSSPAALGMDLAVDNDIVRTRVLASEYLVLHARVALAALWSDETLAPAPRSAPVGAIQRLPQGDELTEADRRHLSGARLETCQVALTGGGDAPETACHALVSTGRVRVHDHPDAGAILGFSRGRTLLLTTCGYLQREILYHNAFYAQPEDLKVPWPDDRPEHILSGDPACEAEILSSEVSPRGSSLHLRFEQYHGTPISLDRRIEIDAGGTLTLIDTATAQAPGWCGGPLLHAEIAEHEVGANPGHVAVRLRQENLRTMKGARFRNPAGSLRAVLAAKPDEIILATPRLPSVYESYRGFPVETYTTLWSRSYFARRCLGIRRTLPQGETVRFVMRLVPEEK